LKSLPGTLASLAISFCLGLAVVIGGEAAGLQGLLAMGLAGFLAGFVFTNLIWGREPSPSLLLALSLASGFLVSVAYVWLKLVLYGIGLEMQGSTTLWEFISLMIRSGVLLVMLLVNGLVATLAAAAATSLVLIIRVKA
jgi:hypothetical protein